jgi:beta-glucosidase
LWVVDALASVRALSEVGTEEAPVSIDAFPPGFVWGLATSAFQIEGATAIDGRGPSIWDDFTDRPGAILGADRGDVACDHYHRMAADVALMARLGAKAYRFSVSWSRVLPDGGSQVNEAGLDFYRRLVDECRANDIEPYPTLYHWDLPSALEDQGGWRRRDVADRFAHYALVMHDALGDRVANWATINEPWCVAWLGHLAGVHAPGERDLASAVAASHHVLLAHGRASTVLRRRGARTAIVLNLSPVPGGPGISDDQTRRIDGLFNRWFADAVLTGRYPADVVDDLTKALEAEHAGLPVDLFDHADLAEISGPIDWMGVNYYHDHVIEADDAGTGGRAFPGTGSWRLRYPNGRRTHSGWPITPPGLTDLLVGLDRRYPNLPPVFITENGAAFEDVVGDGRCHDVERVRFLEEHLRATSQAIAAGVDVRGYFGWSFLDNFEWAEGYDKRFGLVHVDFDTLVRTPKDSAYRFAEIARANAVKL